MREAVVGLLPLYLELYDKRTPELRPRINAFYKHITKELSKRGVTVITSDVCRLKEEFSQAITLFESKNADAIVTLHLAYSPSLESIDILKSTQLPLIVLDTTETFVFDENTPAEEIMYNHGIHGVQDMCNMLLRNNKVFEIFAGHLKNSDVMERIVSAINGAVMASTMKHARIGMVGKPFDGMGDFSVPPEELKRDIGMDIIALDEKEGVELLSSITPQEIEEQYRVDLEAYEWDKCVTREIYDNSEVVCQAIRKWIKRNDLDGFTINFMESHVNKALPTMPFVETSRAMARGIGYAGEGDVMTAALVSSMLSVYSDTTFTEMFCPNWAGDSVFLSHMGEVNTNVVAGKPLLTEKDFPYTDAYNPTVAYGTLKAGKVTMVCLAPAGDGRYNLILCRGQMDNMTPKSDINLSINGWFKPNCTVAQFLEQFSRAGGIHHIVLAYGDTYESLRCFGKFMGFNTITIE